MRARPYFWRTQALFLLESCEKMIIQTGEHSILTLSRELLKFVYEHSSNGQVFGSNQNFGGTFASRHPQVFCCSTIAQLRDLVMRIHFYLAQKRLTPSDHA